MKDGHYLLFDPFGNPKSKTAVFSVIFLPLETIVIEVSAFVSLFDSNKIEG
jgi:hypothetical protein